MDIRHTPGPWNYEPGATSSGTAIFAGKAIVAVAKHVMNATAESNCLANARLIAEAPAMLESLRTISCEIEAWADDENPAGAPSANELAARIAVMARAILARIDGTPTALPLAPAMAS